MASSVQLAYSQVNILCRCVTGEIVFTSLPIWRWQETCCHSLLISDWFLKLYGNNIFLQDSTSSSEKHVAESYWSRSPYMDTLLWCFSWERSVAMVAWPKLPINCVTLEDLPVSEEIFSWSRITTLPGLAREKNLGLILHQCSSKHHNLQGALQLRLVDFQSSTASLT